MKQSYDLPTPAAALLQLARLEGGLSQREVAEKAGVPTTMISSYERDLRQPSFATLLRLLEAAGFDLQVHLVPHDPHDEILSNLEMKRSDRDRDLRDRQMDAWRNATPLGDARREI